MTQSDGTAAEGKIAMVESYPSASTTWTVVGATNASLGATNTMTVQAFVVCSS